MLIFDETMQFRLVFFQRTLWQLIDEAISACVDNKDLAFRWMDKAYQEHSPGIIMLKVDPKYNPIRSDQRFSDLMHRLRIPE